MNFESALQQMKCGKRMSRKSWGSNDFIAIHKPGFFSLRRLPYIYFVDHDKQWQPTQFDVMADDWVDFGIKRLSSKLGLQKRK